LTVDSFEKRFDPQRQYTLTEYKDILEATFVELNQMLSSETGINSMMSGSTGIAVLLHNQQLLCANVGDSRAGVVKITSSDDPGQLVMLSRDHTPKELDELERIIMAGGKVQPCSDPFGNFIGPPRIWDKSGEGPGLMMSRSFGDQSGHKVGMTAVPEVKHLTKDDHHRFLILGSDGLWEKTSEVFMVNTCKKYSKDKDSVDKICRELMSNSVNRWNKECIFYRDDISCIVVELTPPNPDFPSLPNTESENESNPVKKSTPSTPNKQSPPV
jgi:serine/threonine protein phosphatase PrpC